MWDKYIIKIQVENPAIINPAEIKADHVKFMKGDVFKPVKPGVFIESSKVCDLITSVFDTVTNKVYTEIYSPAK